MLSVLVVLTMAAFLQTAEQVDPEPSLQDLDLIDFFLFGDESSSTTILSSGQSRHGESLRQWLAKDKSLPSDNRGDKSACNTARFACTRDCRLRGFFDGMCVTSGCCCRDEARQMHRGTCS